MNRGLIPLKNFDRVSHQVYRSAQPMYNYEYVWLKENLGIRTIINLRAESDRDDRLATKLGIKVVNINVKDHHPPTIEDIKNFKEVIDNPNSYPLLFHCAHGHGRTSTFNVLYSVMKGMTIDEAIAEESKKYHYHFKYKSQIKFLEYLKYSTSNF